MAKLNRVLDFKAILLIIISTIIGNTIFFLPIIGAKYSGTFLLVLWTVISILGIYLSMCFAELISTFPKAGGVYEYAKQAYGRFTSFLIGWLTLILANVTIAILIIGAIHYLLPYQLLAEKTVLLTILSLLFIITFNYIAYKGIRLSAVVLMTFAIISLATICSLIIPGLFRLQLINPNLNLNLNLISSFFIFPISILFFALYLIQQSFFRWESIAFLAEETKAPEKIMPKALIIGTVCIAVFGLLLILSSLNNWQIFTQSITPLADLGVLYFGNIFKTIFTLLAYLIIIGSAVSCIITTPRLILSMARDRLFPMQFSAVHQKYGTPHKAILCQTIICSLFVLIGANSFKTLLIILPPLILIVYTSVLFALLILRFKQPSIKRPYKAPF